MDNATVTTAIKEAVETMLRRKVDYRISRESFGFRKHRMTAHAGLRRINVLSLVNADLSNEFVLQSKEGIARRMVTAFNREACND